MDKKTLPALGVLFIMLWLACASVYAKDAAPPPAKEQTSALAVKTVYDAFKNNKTKASDEYIKKTITVKGFAVSVGPDIYALPSVELSETKGGTARMLCVLPFSDYPELRKVSTGQEVVITGEIRTFYDDKMVLMKNARIVQ